MYWLSRAYIKVVLAFRLKPSVCRHFATKMVNRPESKYRYPYQYLIVASIGSMPHIRGLRHSLTLIIWDVYLRMESSWEKRIKIILLSFITVYIIPLIVMVMALTAILFSYNLIENLKIVWNQNLVHLSSKVKIMFCMEGKQCGNIKVVSCSSCCY